MKPTLYLIGISLFLFIVSMTLLNCSQSGSSLKSIEELNELELTNAEGQAKLAKLLSAGAEHKSVLGLTAGIYAEGIAKEASTPTAGSGYILPELPKSHAKSIAAGIYAFSLEQAVYKTEASAEQVYETAEGTKAISMAELKQSESTIYSWGIMLIGEEPHLILGIKEAEKVLWKSQGAIIYTAAEGEGKASLKIGEKTYEELTEAHFS